MLHLLSRFRRPAETKASRAGAAVALYVAGRPVWTPRDYAALAREGFQQNAVVHRSRAADRRGGGGAAAVADRGRAHRRCASAARAAAPARTRARAARASSRASTAICSCPATPMSRPSRSTARRASSTRCGPTACAWCRAGRLAGGLRLRRRRARPCASLQTGEIPPILHLTLFHPADDHYGLSPMEAAAVALDLHNAAGAWNKALLDNAARPSGALVFASGAAGAAIERGQFDRLKEELETNYQGARTPAARCCSKAGSTGSRCRCRRRTWISSRRRTPPRARSRSPSACRRCCSALPATTPTPTTPRPTAPSTARR